MKIKDYNDAMEFFRTNDYQAADGAWSEFYQSKVLEPRIMDLAEGGRIGFMSGLSARTQNLVSLYDIAKLDLPIPEATIRQVFQTPDRAKAYKKIFKDNGIKIVATGKQRKALFKKPTQKQIDGVWEDTIKLVKEGKGTVPDKMRIPFKNEVLKIFDEFNKTGTPFSTSDIYYKLVENVQDNPRIFLPAKRKGGTRVPGEEIKRALGKEKADLLLDGNIQRIEKTIGNRKKLVEILSKGESDINTLAKTLNISKKDLFAEADILFDDVYRYNSHKVRKTGWGEKYGYLKDYEIKDFKNILNNLRASGFEKLDERSIRALITDAYAETSPKKYDAAMKKLSQYNKINNELKKVFGFNFELDHPLSFQNLKNIGNVSPENLLRVTPIPKDINRIKIGLDGTYNNILSALRSGDTSPALLNQKKAIETIAKNLGIGEFKVSKTGDKILSFGAKPFLKTDLIGGMQENIHLQNQIAENLKNIDSEELETAFGKKSKMPASIKKLKPVDTKKILKFFKDSGIPCIKGEGAQCNSIMDYQKGYNKLVQEAADGKGSAKAINKLGKFTKGIRALGTVGKWTGYGVLAELGFMVPFAIGDYAAGESWKRILGNATDYGFGPIFGQSEQEEFEAALPEGSAAPQRRKIYELGERLHKLENQKVNPGYGRPGFRQRAETSRQKVYDSILDEYILNMQPFMRPTPHTEYGQFYDQGLMDKAEQEDIATMEKLEAERQARIDERTERGIIADQNWQSQIPPRYAQGGIASLKKKW